MRKIITCLEITVTTLVVDALKSAGIKSPTSTRKWTLNDGAHNLIVDNLPKEMTFKNIFTWWLMNSLNSPGDAVEDIRNAGAKINTNDLVSISSGGKNMSKKIILLVILTIGF